MKKEYKYPYRAIKVNGKTKLVHRHVMELHIGRPLMPNECVHHKDRDKSNNSIDNLEIMTRAEHIKHHQERGEIPKAPTIVSDEIRIEYCERLSYVTADEAKRIKYGGEKTSLLRKELGVSRFLVNRIRTGRSWRHI